MVISSTKSGWSPGGSSALRRSVRGPVLFNIFVNGLGDGAEGTLSKVADNTKKGGLANTPEGCAATQRNLERLEKIPAPGMDTSMQQY